jgi:hypothetical protein
MPDTEPFFDHEKPRLTLDQLQGVLAGRFRGGETAGPIVDELRLYLLARSYQNWSDGRLVAHAREAFGLDQYYTRNLLKSIGTAGRDATQYDRLMVDSDGRQVVVESAAGNTLHSRRLRLHEAATNLAAGGRTGDGPPPRQAEHLDLGFTPEQPGTRLRKQAERRWQHLLLGVVAAIAFAVILAAAAGVFLLIKR